MRRYILVRIAQGIFTVFLVVSVVFILIRLAPGDPAYALAGQTATSQQLAEVRHHFGLDQPLYVQYGLFLAGLARGDLGTSFSYGQGALQVVLLHLPYTLMLAVAGILLTAVIAVPLGVLAARKANSTFDTALNVATITGQSMPDFWLGIMLIVVFAVTIPIFPTSGFDNWGAIVLPAATIAILQTAVISRVVRREMLRNLAASFVSVGRARGVSEAALTWQYALGERRDPGGDRARDAVRRHAQRSRARGSGLLLARRWVAHRPGARDPGLPADPGHRAGHGGADDRRAAPGRPRLPGPRSAGPARQGGEPMSSAPAIEAVPRRELRRSAAARRARSIRVRIGVGGVLVALVVLPVLLAGLLPLPGPLDQSLPDRLRPPGAGGHLFGTDQLGRDLLSRLLHGGQVSLRIGLLAVLVSGIVGVLAGVAAGYFGGWLDSIVSRLIEAQLSLPLLMLLLLVVALFGPSVVVITAVIALAQWPEPARLARGLTLVEREKPHIDAARVMGGRHSTIVFRHIVPNIVSPVLVVVLLLLAQAVLLESALSYLGVGVQRPYPTWGRIIADGQQYVTSAWWLVTLPGLAIALLVVGVNLLGEGLRDMLADGRE